MKTLAVEMKFFDSDTGAEHRRSFGLSTSAEQDDLLCETEEVCAQVRHALRLLREDREAREVTGA